MTDVLTPEQRHRNMASIRSRDTSPEKLLRSRLFRCGYRFRLCDKHLPGSPDIVLKRYHTVIFVHGCYWHRHQGCKYATTPASNTEFWKKKFQNNVERDKQNTHALLVSGWHVVIVWECQLKHHCDSAVEKVVEFLQQAKSLPSATVCDLSQINFASA